jgi:hypothetical protein
MGRTRRCGGAAREARKTDHANETNETDAASGVRRSLCWMLQRGVDAEPHHGGERQFTQP